MLTGAGQWLMEERSVETGKELRAFLLGELESIWSFFERAFGGSTSPVDPHCHGFLNADLAD